LHKTEEILQTLLFLLQSKCFPSHKQAAHLSELVQNTVEDLASVKDLENSSALKLEVVLALCKTRTSLSAQDLLRSHLLNSEVAEKLLHTHKKVGKALAARGLSLDFLEYFFPQVPWLTFCEQRFPADPGCVRLLATPIELNRLSDPEQAFSCLPAAEQFHFCGVFRLDQRPTVIPMDQLRPYFRHRRRLLWWMRERASLGLPEALWRAIVEQFLYPH